MENGFSKLKSQYLLVDGVGTMSVNPEKGVRHTPRKIIYFRCISINVTTYEIVINCM
jgi:hypothetical protein